MYGHLLRQDGRASLRLVFLAGTMQGQDIRRNRMLHEWRIAETIEDRAIGVMRDRHELRQEGRIVGIDVVRHEIARVHEDPMNRSRWVGERGIPMLDFALI